MHKSHFFLAKSESVAKCSTFPKK